jgi:hypothetical protein
MSMEQIKKGHQNLVRLSLLQSPSYHIFIAYALFWFHAPFYKNVKYTNGLNIIFWAVKDPAIPVKKNKYLATLI